MDWLYDQAEVVLAIALAIAAAFKISCRIGAKMEHLEHATTAGLDAAGQKIDYVRASLSRLEVLADKAQQERRKQHDQLVHHRVRLDVIDSKLSEVARQRAGTDS